MLLRWHLLREMSCNETLDMSGGIAKERGGVCCLLCVSLYGPIVYRNVGKTMHWFDLRGPHNSKA